MARQALQAPARSGDVLVVPDWEDVPALIEENRRNLASTSARIAGLPLAEFRQAARRELFQCLRVSPDAETPLIMTGHQPEFFHPGVWLKNFAMSRLVRRTQGIGVNLIVDHDVLKTTSVAVPTWSNWSPDFVHAVSLPVAENPGPVPSENANIGSELLWQSFPKQLRALTEPWGFEPMAVRLNWNDPSITGTRNLGERVTRLRRAIERSWGADHYEMAVSQLCQLDGFGLFVQEIERNSAQFRQVFNDAVREYRKRHGLRSRSHPVPELTDHELPFWDVSGPLRRPVHAKTPRSSIRPRALTLTLFVRLFLCDWFIHGLGGGIYDEVTNTIIRNYFGVNPPHFQIVTGTLHLPLPRFPATPADLTTLHHELRDRQWNPWRYGTPPSEELHEREELLQLPQATKRDRQHRFRKLQALVARDRIRLVEENRQLEAKCRTIQSEVAANSVLQKRDYAWILYPEDSLREFLTRDRVEVIRLST